LVNAELLTEHTFFQAQVAGSAINLSNGPWVAASAVWAHGSDCTETQAVAEAARDRGMQWICDESVRAPGKRCAAVLDVEALEMVGDTAMQTWHCKASRQAVMLINRRDNFVWNFWLVWQAACPIWQVSS
jgi:hypothetical protein